MLNHEVICPHYQAPGNIATHTLWSSETVPSHLAPSTWKRCITILMAREQLTEEEAEEWMEVNVASTWMGDGTPGFVRSQ